MASPYHDSYETHLRAKSREPSYDRLSNEETFLRPPTTGRHHNHLSQALGNQHDRGRDAYSDKLTSIHGHHDGHRHHPPPPIGPYASRSPRPSPSPHRRRRSWPPGPMCEDEATSLAKEVGTRKILSAIGKDEAKSRGVVDQEPIIQDAITVTTLNEHRSRAHPRADSVSTMSPEVLTPPTSEDEKARKTDRRPSKLDMTFQRVDTGIPELNKRIASPYAYSRSATMPKSSVAKEQLLSPDVIYASPLHETARRKGTHGVSRSQPSSPRRDSARSGASPRRAGDYFGGEESAVVDADDDLPTSLLSSRKPSTYPPLSATTKKASSARTSPTTSTIDFAAQLRPSAAHRPAADARRNTDTINTLKSTTQLNVDKTRKPSSLLARGGVVPVSDAPYCASPIERTLGADLLSQGLGEQSVAYKASREVSPGNGVGTRKDRNTSRSPRVSAEYARDHGPRSASTSRPTSVVGSRQASPSQQTPDQSPRLPQTEHDWSTLLAVNAARRPRQSSRLNTSIQHESTIPPPPPPPPLDARRPSPAARSSLPYPVDDGPSTPIAYMPSERAHQYFPDARSSLSPASFGAPRPVSRGETTVPPSERRSAAATKVPAGLTPRPALQTRHSSVETPSTEARLQADRPRGAESRRLSSNIAPQAKKDIQKQIKRLPPCPRVDPLAGHDDWYTLIGAPRLLFCPDCVTSNFDRTIYRTFIRRSPPQSLKTNLNCALGGSAWTRLAWLLTQQQQRTDLNLLKDLADIEETVEACPGHIESARTWYGIRNAEGILLSNFRICFNDVQKVERMLPTLQGLFACVPARASYEKSCCALRPGTNRFSPYLDSLIATHDAAVASRRPPDPFRFINLVERKTRLRECTRDQVHAGQLWHTIPSLPAFTVCEDCYDAVVEPAAVHHGHALALRFARTKQPAYNEGAGSSCQLYSRRMRRVFQRALEDDDLRYLARKANERREAEVRLQEKAQAIRQRMQRLSWGGPEVDAEVARLEEVSRRIGEEWIQEWE